MSTHIPAPGVPNGAAQNGVKNIVAQSNDARPVLITGGAGFVGVNLAQRLLNDGKSVLLFDDLSRAGVENNLARLQKAHASAAHASAARDNSDALQVEIADICDAHALRRAVDNCSAVFHFAAQVAVTTSLDDPLRDFEVNARGTLNLLEAVRAQVAPPPLIFTSTNKVYGDLNDIGLRLNGERYEPVDDLVREFGIGEARRLDFHSPYGCSKGAADQYVLDYARTFDLPAVVFRMSCIYGPQQCGNEDQGWVAHFLLRALQNRDITLFGDGRQVRDALFVEDLVDALLLAHNRIVSLSGEAFNLGGGPQNTTSLLELVSLIGELRGESPDLRFDAWRAGDQRYYVSDTRRFQAATGWMPRVSVREGVEILHAWLLENSAAISSGRDDYSAFSDMTRHAVEA